jgi:hypothetical protein
MSRWIKIKIDHYNGEAEASVTDDFLTQHVVWQADILKDLKYDMARLYDESLSRMSNEYDARRREKKINQRRQIKAHIHLIKYALERNCTISVDGGGTELDLVDGSQFQQILDDVEACDITTMLINKNGKQVGWASVVLEYEQDPAETINDLSASEFMDAWEEQYNKDFDAAKDSI